MNLRRQANAATFLSHVNENAAAFLGNLAQSGVQLIPAIATARAEDVAGQAFAVHADKCRFVFGDLTLHQREVMRTVDFGAIKMKIERAIFGRQRDHLLAFHQFLPHAPVRDQALDRANAQPMFFLELHQLRQPRHRSVVVQNFAENSGRLQSGEARKIHCRFGVAGAAQHTAVFCSQREDVAGLHEICRCRFRIGNRLNRRRTIVRADAGGHAVRRIH